jgi:hypothetical protein
MPGILRWIQHPCNTVAAGESCVLWIKFSPSEFGVRLARLKIRTKDGTEFSSAFTGRGTPILSVVKGKHDDNDTDIHVPAVSPPQVSQLENNTQSRPDIPSRPTRQGELPQKPPGTVTSIPSTVFVPPVIPAVTREPHPTPIPHLTVTPTTLQFRSSSPDSEFFTPVTRTITLSSDGTADLRQLILELNQPAGPFSFSTNCPTTLGRGEICNGQVKFAPRDSRQYTGTLSAFAGNVSR